MILNVSVVDVIYCALISSFLVYPIVKGFVEGFREAKQKTDKEVKR